MALEIDAAKTKRASLCPVTPAEYEVASAHVGTLAHGGVHAGAAGPGVDLPAADAAGLAEHIAYLTMTRSFERVFGEVARATPQPQPVPGAEGVGGLPLQTMTTGGDGCDANAAPTPTSYPELDPENEVDASPDVAWYEAVYPERAALIRALLALRPLAGGKRDVLCLRPADAATPVPGKAREARDVWPTLPGGVFPGNRYPAGTPVNRCRNKNVITHRKIGAPWWIRTTDPQLRRLLLYPTELRALASELITPRSSWRSSRRGRPRSAARPAPAC